MHERPREPGDAAEIPRRRARAAGSCGTARGRGRPRTAPGRLRRCAQWHSACARAYSAGLTWPPAAAGAPSTAVLRPPHGLRVDLRRQRTHRVAVDLRLRIAPDGGDRRLALLVGEPLAQLRHDRVARLFVRLRRWPARLPSSRITCQPNCDCTGSDRSPTLASANAAVANAGSISFCVNQPSVPVVLRRRRVVGELARELAHVGAGSDLRARLDRELAAPRPTSRFLVSNRMCVALTCRRVRERAPCRRGRARARAPRSSAMFASNSALAAASMRLDLDRREEAVDLELRARAATSGRVSSLALRACAASDFWTSMRSRSSFTRRGLLAKPSRMSGGSFRSSASYSARVTLARLLETSTVSGRLRVRRGRPRARGRQSTECECRSRECGDSSWDDGQREPACKKKGRGLLLAPEYSLKPLLTGAMLVVTLWLKLPP